MRDATIAIGDVLGLTGNRMQVLRARLYSMTSESSAYGIACWINWKLTDAEYTKIKTHPGIGTSTLNRVAAFSEIAVFAGEHHEQLDGFGYPCGLREHDLSIESRILAVADM